MRRPQVEELRRLRTPVLPGILFTATLLPNKDWCVQREAEDPLCASKTFDRRAVRLAEHGEFEESGQLTHLNRREELGTPEQSLGRTECLLHQDGIIRAVPGELPKRRSDFRREGKI